MMQQSTPIPEIFTSNPELSSDDDVPFEEVVDNSDTDSSSSDDMAQESKTTILLAQDNPSSSSLRSMRRLTQAVRVCLGYEDSPVSAITNNRSISLLERFKSTSIYTAAFFTFLTFGSIFEILAGEAMGEGVPTTIFQALGLPIGSWIHEVGLTFLFYIICLEPMLWKATHPIKPKDDLLYDLMQAQSHARGTIKHALLPVQPVYALLPEGTEDTNDTNVPPRALRTMTRYGSVQTQDLERSFASASHLLTPSHPVIAFMGASLGLPRYVVYAVLSPLAACVGIPTTFLQWVGTPLSLSSLSMMRIGAYAGVLLASLVQGSHIWLSPANQQVLEGAGFEVFSHSVANPPAAIKALLQSFWPSAFSTEDVELSDTPLSVKTIITCLLGIPLGMAYRVLLFVVAAAALVPGLAAAYAYFRGLVISPEAAEVIRLSSLPVMLQAAEIEIARIVTAEFPHGVKPGHATPGLVTEEAGTVHNLAQALAYPHQTGKKVFDVLSSGNVSFFSRSGTSYVPVDTDDFLPDTEFSLNN